MCYSLVAVAIFVLCFYVYKSYYKSAPGPWNLPIVGALPRLDPKQPHVTLTRWAKEYGPVYGLKLGSVYTVVMTDPRTIRNVFCKDATTGRAPLYLTHGIMNGYGLICAEGERWKDQRKFIHHALRQFGASKIGKRDKMEQLIMENALDFVKFVKEKGKEVRLDPLEGLRHSLGSVINDIVFGKSWSRDDETWKWLQHLQEEGTKHIGVAGPLNFLSFLIKIPMYRRTMDFLMEGKLETHKVYQQLIDEQEKFMKSVDYASNENLIQAFLQERHRRNGTNNEYYCDQQFYHLLADVFGAGLDTTLTTMRWYLLYMATNSEIQKAVRSQINEMVPNSNLSLNDLWKLPLVEASIMEAQRIRSVVPVGIPHGSLDYLEIGGYKVPPNTMLIPLQWAIHMNEDIFPDPERFDPHRFLDEDGNLCRNDYFMPFQTGKRMCIGDELARMLLFLFCATIVQNFELSVEDLKKVDLTGDCGITLTPKPQKIIFKDLYM